MRKYFTTLCLLFFIAAAFGQPARKKVGFIPFAKFDPKTNDYRNNIYEAIYEMATRIFINTQRFEVLDREKFDIVRLEKDFQKGDDFINSQIVKQGNALAAEVLAVAKITSIAVEQAADKGGWSAFIVAECKQIDVETVKALNAYRLEGSCKDQPTVPLTNLPNPERAKTAQEAIAKALAKMQKELEKWITTNFPIKVGILGVECGDNKEYVVVTDGGQDIGMTDKHKMRLVEIKTYGDKQSLIPLVENLSFMPGSPDPTTARFKVSKSYCETFKKKWEADKVNILVTERQ